MGDRIPTLVPFDIDLERIAERARRRDLFAAAALAGLLARPTIDDDPLEFHFLCEHAHKWADAMLAVSDATAGAASASVPPAPVSRPAETRQTQRGGA